MNTDGAVIQCGRPTAVWLPVLIVVAAILTLPLSAHAKEPNPLRVQLIWRTSTEFAGYYVAQTKGYYAEHGLQVELMQGGPNIKPLERLETGTADVAVAWLPNALNARKRGLDVVNIAQIFQRPEMALACRKSPGLLKPADILGKKIAIWGIGDAAALQSLLAHFNIGMGQVTLVRQGFKPEALINGQADCATVMLYNEYWSLLQSGLTPGGILLLPFRKYSSGFLENGLYVRADSLENPVFVDQLARFLQATAAGWHDAGKYPRTALAMVMARNSDLNRERQKLMLDRVLASIGAGPFGLLNIDEYQRSVHLLAANKDDQSAFLERARGAWTHRVWRQAGLDSKNDQLLTRATSYRLAQTVGSFWFHLLDLVGTAAFGLAGFMRARKHRYDLFGALVLTLLPAVGGGTLRDLLIGDAREPLYLFTDPSYIAVVLGVVVVGTVLSRILPEDSPETSGFQKRLLIFDTLGLSLFSIIGAAAALLAGVPWYWAVFCSALTCAGGGVLLDVVTGHEPRTFRGEPYEELGMLGGLLLCAGLVVVNHFEHAPWLLPCIVAFIFMVVYTLRILVVTHQWRTYRLGMTKPRLAGT